MKAISPTDGSNSNDNDLRQRIHARQWFGVHDLYKDTGNWYATFYGPATGLNGDSGGVWRSTDKGATWSQISPAGRRALRRAVYVDSCGHRITVSSGRGFSSPVNQNDFDQPGLEQARPSGGSLSWSNLGVNSQCRYPQAHAMVKKGASNIWYAAPGYGVYDGYVGETCNGGGGCETPPCEGDLGGGEQQSAGDLRFSSDPSGEEAIFAAELIAGSIRFTIPPRTSGTIEIYDIAGRRVDTIKVGVRTGSVMWSGRSGIYVARLGVHRLRFVVVK